VYQQLRGGKGVAELQDGSFERIEITRADPADELLAVY
jgi:hypothetical protein